MMAYIIIYTSCLISLIYAFANFLIIRKVQIIDGLEVEVPFINEKN